MAFTFFVQLLLNSLIVWIANTLFPANIVLGNANSNMTWALFHSMVMLSLIGTLAVPLFVEARNDGQGSHDCPLDGRVLGD